MLPTFQIRGLRFCATDFTEDGDEGVSKNYLDLDSLITADGTSSSSAENTVGSEWSVVGGSVDEQPWADIQLEKKNDYDDLIRDHPEATLAYVDEDDGDMITVGSSHELFTRIDELLPQTPIVFDLRNTKGLGIWRRELQRIHRQQRLRQAMPSITSVIERSQSPPKSSEKDKGPLVDLTPDDSAESRTSTPSKDAQTQLFQSFESELQRLMGGMNLDEDKKATETKPQYTMRGAVNEPAVQEAHQPPRPQSEQSERVPSPPIELPEPSTSSHEVPRNPLANFISNLPGRNQQIFTSLRSSIFNIAQASASAARTAATFSRDLPVAEFENGIRTISSSLNTVAREAAAAAAQAAEATRGIDVSELQKLVDSMGNTLKEIGEAYQHVGQVVGGEVNRVVRDVVEGRTTGISKGEAKKEKEAIEKAMEEFLRDGNTTSGEPAERKDDKGKGKEKATVDAPRPVPPPRPFVEEVVDEEAPGRHQSRIWEDEEEVLKPMTAPTAPPVPPKEPETTYRPSSQVRSPTPPPVPKKTPLDTTSYEQSASWTQSAPRAPDYDDEGDSSESSEEEVDVEEDEEGPSDFLPNVHAPRMHEFIHPGSMPSTPYRQPTHYPHHFNPWGGSQSSLPGGRADLLRRGLHRREQSMRMLPRDDGFPMNPPPGPFNPALKHRMSCPAFPPMFPQPSPHPSPPGMGHMSPASMPGIPPQPFPAVRSSPPRMPHMPHLPQFQQSLGGYAHFPPQRFPGDMGPWMENEHVPPFIGSPGQPPFPPPPPFAPQPPHHEFSHFVPPPPGMMPGPDFGMYSRFLPYFGLQMPSPAQAAYNAAVKRALSRIPLPTLQEQLQNPQLAKRLWEEMEHVANEVEVPPGVVGWTRMPFEELVRLRLEAGEEAILRARRVGEEGIDHRDVSLEEEDEEDRMPMENPFATPPRMNSPAHMGHGSRRESLQDLPNFTSSRPGSRRSYAGPPPQVSPVKQGSMFPQNFRPSPVPITPASPASFRHSSPFLQRRTSMNSNNGSGSGNVIYGGHNPSPSPAVPIDARRGTPVIPAVPVGGYSTQNSPAVPVDHRHMPSAPAVPADDGFNLSSPLLPHIPPHRTVHHPLHRGTPPVPDAPENERFRRPSDENSRQPQSPFMNPFPPHFFTKTPPPPSYFARTPPPVPPPPHRVWQSSPVLRGLHRAHTMPTQFSPMNVPPPPINPLRAGDTRGAPAAYNVHHGGAYYDDGLDDTCDSIPCLGGHGLRNRNPFFEEAGRPPQVRPVVYGPPAAFWPPAEGLNEEDEEGDDDDDEYGDDESIRMGTDRERSVSEVSFRSEELRRGRSPTAKGPRAQPGYYTPPPPPPFRQQAKQETQHQQQVTQPRNMKEEEHQPEDQEQQQQPQRHEQHEPSAPNSPVLASSSSSVLPPLPPPPATNHQEQGQIGNSISSQPPQMPGSFAMEPQSLPLLIPIESPSAASTPTLSSPTPYILGQQQRQEHQEEEVQEVQKVREDVPMGNPFSLPPSPVGTPKLVLRGLHDARPSRASDDIAGPSDNNNDSNISNSSPETATMPGHFDSTIATTGRNTIASIRTTYNPNPFSGFTNTTTQTAYTIPSPPPVPTGSEIVRRSNGDSHLDECIAQLVDMGYNYMPWLGEGDEGGDQAMERLRIVASAVFGDVEAAIDLLEEDLRGWQGEQGRLLRDAAGDRMNVDENEDDGVDRRSEGWRLAGWY